MDMPLTAAGLERHSAFVRRIAHSLLQDEHLAEDLAQETWLRWMQRPPHAAAKSGEGEAAATRGWLRSVSRNLAANFDRARRRRHAREEASARTEAQPSTADQLEQQAALRSLVDAVLALDEPYRSVIWMRYFREMSVREIAGELAIAEPTVRSRSQRALARLHERLQAEFPERERWTAALLAIAGPESTVLPPVAGAAGPAMGSGGLAGGLKVGGLVAVAATVAGVLFWPRESALPSVAPVAAPTANLTAQLEAPAGQERERTSVAASPNEPAQTPVPAGQIRVRGTVWNGGFEALGLEAGPAANLDFEVYPDERVLYQASPPPGVPVSCDDEGQFEVLIDDAGARPVTVLLRLEGDASYRDVRHGVKLEEGVRSIEDVEVLRAPHGILYGETVDGAGQPLAGVEVQLRNWNAEEKPAQCVSGEDGRFELALEGYYRNVSAHFGGYSLLDAPPLRAREEGGWEFLRLVLVRAASVEVTVVDSAGERMEDVSVTVQPAASEWSKLDVTGGFGGPGVRKVSGKTDERGRVLLEGLWAGTKLSVRTRRSWQHQFESDAALGASVLAPAERERGSPIVLGPGELRELEVMWRGAVELRVRVVDESGAPVPEPNFQLFDLGVPPEGGDGAIAAGSGDTDGRFEITLETPQLIGPFELVATEKGGDDGGLGGLRGLGYAGEAPASDAEAERAGRLRFERAVLDAEDPELELVLEEELTIQGDLYTTEGERVQLQPGLGSGHRVWAVRAGTPHPFGGAQGRERVTVTFPQEGGFLVRGLQPGAYDFFVSEEMGGFYSFATRLHHFSGIQAGSLGVRLDLGEIADVRVRIRGPEEDGGHWTVLHASLYPDDANLPRREAPREQRITALDGWPEQAPLSFHGVSGGQSDLGATRIGLYGAEPGEHELPKLGPGWYSFGLHGRAADGTPLFPVATPWQYYAGGEYLIELPAVPTTTLQGRMGAASNDRFWAVALVDAEGRLVPLRVHNSFGRLSKTVGVSADGSFVLQEVPVGAYRLRLGSPEALERGEFVREVPLALEAGTTSTVEL